MNKKMLIANGCSMTYGLELFDDDNGACRDDGMRLANAWPSVLAEILGIETSINLAVNSGSNDRILRTTISSVSDCLISYEPQDILVVIGWSGSNRREFYVDGEWRQVVPYHEQENTKLNELVEVYRKVALDEVECSVRLLTEIVSMQSFLRDLGIQYVFFDSISPIREQIAIAGKIATLYTKLIKQDCYLNYSSMNGCMADVLRTDGNYWLRRHPSSVGHRRWADILLSFISEGRSGAECSYGSGLETRMMTEPVFVYK